MKSKTQIHQFCEMIMLNTRANQPLATDKLIKILKKSLEKWDGYIFAYIHIYFSNKRLETIY